jgi:hypothetical protein
MRQIVRVLGPLGDDIDDAAHAIERGSGPLEHGNAFDAIGLGLEPGRRAVVLTQRVAEHAVVIGLEAAQEKGVVAAVIAIGVGIGAGGVAQRVIEGARLLVFLWSHSNP